MCRFSSIIRLCIVICQWSMVTSVQDSIILKKLSDSRVSDGHRNMLTEVLKTGNEVILPGQPKLRFKRVDYTFYTPVATIRQEKVFLLLLDAILNILKTTWYQGALPLRPSFPKEVVRGIKGTLTA